MEKIVELTCGHTCHEECLWLLISEQNKPADLHKVFPRCETCGVMTSPIDESLSDVLVSRYLISEPKFQALSLQSRNSKDLSINVGIQQPPVPRCKTHKSRGSSISAMSSIVSSVTKSPLATKFDTDISLALLRSEHITSLVRKLQSNSVDVTEAVIDAMGLLRLVDKLSVSVDGAEFKDYNVYLFQYELVLVHLRYVHCLRFPVQHVRVTTPNQATLQLVLQNTGFFIKQRDSKVLQKWITALCDLEQLFDCDSLSSTVDVTGLHPVKEVVPSPVETARDPKPMEDEIKFSKPEELLLVIDHTIPLQQRHIITLQNICRVVQAQFKQFSLLCTNGLSEVYGDNIEQIGQGGDTIGTLEAMIPTSGTLGVCVITTGDVERASTLGVKNRLVVQVGSSKAKSKAHVVCVPFWDDIMECLMTKYEISFEASDVESDFDSDFDSDTESYTSEEVAKRWSGLFQDIEDAMAEAVG